MNSWTPPAHKALDRFRSFAYRLNLATKHLHPRRRVAIARQIKGLSNGISGNQPIIERIHGAQKRAHAAPPDALASLAACAAAGVALGLSWPEQGPAFPLFPFIDGLFFRTGELGALDFGH